MKKIAIVGAGLSGLYLASLLQEHFDVTILEAKGRIGGRVLTQDGHDLGPSWVWPHQSTILNLLDELDIGIFRQYTKGDALYQANDQVQRFNSPPSPVSMRLEGGIDLLIQKLHAKLSNTTIHLDTQVNKIVKHDDAIELVSDTTSYFADEVIITAPPRVALNIAYEPTLESTTTQTLQNIATWMGHSRKVVVTFANPFWRENNLSGFAFSHTGICGEIHDATTAKEAALFGFVKAGIDTEDIKSEVITQLVSLFGEEAKHYTNYYDKNWRLDPFSSVREDWHLREHPLYGHKIDAMDNKLHFISTEASFKQGGYLDGALAAGQKFAHELMNRHF